MSSWAFWGGLLSNATEIHVNAPPHHSVMYGMNQYVYHNEKTSEYFGSYIASKNDIIYRTNLTNHHHAKLRAKAILQTHSNVSSASTVEYIADKKNDTHHNITTASAAVLGSTVPVSTKAADSAHPAHTTATTSSIGAIAVATTASSNRLPIVYVFTVVPAICAFGLPSYIRTSIEQGIFTQPDSDVILVSNFAECSTLAASVKDMPLLKLVDSTIIISNRTLQYKNVSASIFMTDGGGELWLTSALRFFIMEDLMRTFGYTELIHVEADNMIYGRFTSLLPVLRSGYQGISATPLNAQKSFITASVMYVSSLQAMLDFNEFLMELATNVNLQWKKYLTWLRPYGCCRPGGVDPDAAGNGIKPFAINEMSMLAYYHEINPQGFRIFPVVPAHTYNLNKYVVNMSRFGPYGDEVGPPTGHGIWDPNSWGQLIGGTATKKGRDKGFTDPSHIAGQAIRMNGCVVRILCGNQTVSPYAMPPVLTSLPSPGSASSNISPGSGSVVSVYNNIDEGALSVPDKAALRWWKEHQETQCYTAPFVRCSDDSPWTPLWNLHVHSKHTVDYKSHACECPAS